MSSPASVQSARRGVVAVAAMRSGGRGRRSRRRLRSALISHLQLCHHSPLIVLCCDQAQPGGGDAKEKMKMCALGRGEIFD